MLNTLTCFCRLGKSNIASTVEGHTKTVESKEPLGFIKRNDEIYEA